MSSFIQFLIFGENIKTTKNSYARKLLIFSFVTKQFIFIYFVVLKTVYNV